MQKHNENQMLISLIAMLFALAAVITIFFPSVKYVSGGETIRAFGLETTFGAKMNSDYHFNVVAFIAFLVSVLALVLNYILLNDYEKKMYIVLLVIYLCLAVFECFVPLLFKLSNPHFEITSMNILFGPILSIALYLVNAFIMGFCIHKINKGEY